MFIQSGLYPLHTFIITLPSKYLLWMYLQVLVTGSLHLVGDVLKLLREWYVHTTILSIYIIQNILELVWLASLTGIPGCWKAHHSLKPWVTSSIRLLTLLSYFFCCSIVVHCCLFPTLISSLSNKVIVLCFQYWQSCIWFSKERTMKMWNLGNSL